MATKRITGATGEPKAGRSGRTCADCGDDLSDWRGGDPRHCAGISYAFGARKWGEPHHCIELHPRCWKCHEPLGCRLCSGIAAELLCENVKAHNGLGAVWGTKAAFLEHGPMVLQRNGRKQTLEDYPREWAIEYEPLEVKPVDLAMVADLMKRTWR